MLATLAVAAWSYGHAPKPNGTLAFGTGEYVFTVRADGSGGHALVPGDYPAYSRAGLLAFTSHGVWVARGDGTHRRRIVPPFAEYLTYTSPAWSPRGKQLAYIRVDNGHETDELWLVHADGSGLHGLSVVHQAASPTWSPDGSWIAYAGDGGLTEVRPDGSRKRLLAGGTIDSPAWSPNGAHIAYELESGRRVTIRLLDPKRRTSRTLVPSVRAAGPLAWSPDGRFLAFATETGAAGGAVVQVHMLEVASGRQRIVTRVFAQHLDGLTWRPD